MWLRLMYRNVISYFTYGYTFLHFKSKLNIFNYRYDFEREREFIYYFKVNKLQVKKYF